MCNCEKIKIAEAKILDYQDHIDALRREINDLKQSHKEDDAKEFAIIVGS